jgi:uncharacterized protein (DUF2252 family)
MAPSVVSRILRFNDGREPERLALKYAAMRRSPFGFFRGTAHLFYRDWAAGSPLDASPLTWACGDLHLENFGSFKGVNGLAYFDMNDFDEAALAPAGRDLARFATSTALAIANLGLPAADGRAFAHQAHLAYTHALRVGKPLWVERSTARGLVKQLLRRVKRRTRRHLLEERTTVTRGRRRLRIDGRHALTISRESRDQVVRALALSRVAREDPTFFRVIDVARRIAGTGSLGLQRAVILINGHGGPDGNVLLDLKQAAPSALAPTVRVRQPRWTSEAERVVTIQRRVQAVSPDLLRPLRLGRKSYILRELQPTEDRLALTHASDEPDRLQDALRVMANVVAWGQLRSGGHQGSATADEWIEFGHDRSWARPLFDFARSYTDVVRGYWKEYCAAYDSGAFDEQQHGPRRGARPRTSAQRQMTA